MGSFNWILSKLPGNLLESFVLTGCSAGGAATLMWANTFYDRVMA